MSWNRSLRSIRNGLICLFLAPLIHSCGASTEPPLRIASNIWIGYEPLYLARSLGQFSEETISLVELTSASEVLHAMRNGTIEGAALTLDETLILLEDGFDLRVILILDYSNGADAILGQPNLSTLKDLKGKRVAVEYTAVGAIMLGTALQLAGLTTEDIEIIHSPLDEHKKTFADVDAIVTFEPLRTQILNDGAKLLFDSSQIPERIIDVVVVFEKTMRTHPKALRNLVQGYFKARKYMTENPEAAFVRLAPRLGLTVDQVKTAYEGITLTELSGNEALLKGSEPKLNSIAEDLATFMFEQNLLHRNVNTDFLGEGKFLRNE